MVICDNPAFLFIHVPKAAGTSVTGALAHLDLFRAAKRKKDLAERKKWIAAKGFNHAVLDLPIHASAKHARDVIGEENFTSLYKFAIVRNPWDMELSWYSYNAQTESAPHYREATTYRDFGDYVKRHLSEHGRLLAPGPQTKYVMDGAGNSIVDRILRYENLAADFASVIDHLEIDGVILDQFNQSYHVPWPEAYTPETFTLAREWLQSDIEAFGYSDDPESYGIK